MTLRRRLDKLEGGRQSALTVFLTAYDNESGDPEVARALVIYGTWRTVTLEREAGETEAAFRARIPAE